jgi:hypothetical protein
MASETKKWSADRSHWVVQFDRMPDAPQLDQWKAAGVEILGYVPDLAMLVRASDAHDWTGAGVSRALRLSPEDKFSPAFDDSAGSEPTAFVIEVYPGIDPGIAREIATREGFALRTHADLLETHLLAVGTLEQAWRVASWDEVAYVFPASRELTSGLPVRACAGAITSAGYAANLAAKVGEGWDGAGKNKVDLRYSFGALTDKLPASVVESEIERALGEWAKYVEIAFVRTGNPYAEKSIHFLFASRDHGDSYDFDGRGGGLAHAFYPAPPNPEVIAGDLHFDGDEVWRTGIDTDLFSVALHELGHSLGLGHSDSPQAIMYPYYRRVSRLATDDIAAIRELYAPREPELELPGGPLPPPPPIDPVPPPANPPPSTPATPPVTAPDPPRDPAGPADRTPPSLQVLYPATTSLATGAAFLTVRGAAGDNIAVTGVSWTSSTGVSGTASGTKQWVADSIPLLKGTNYLIIRALDAAGNSAWRSLVVTRR